MSINTSLEIGQRALRASQLGLTVTGQNIANVNTPGYSRQDVELASSVVLGKPQPAGNGVDVVSIKAFRDQFIEGRLQAETANTGRLTAQQQTLAPLEEILNESNSGGINQALNDFFGSFRNLDANPTSISLRTATIENASDLANVLSSTRSRLVDARNSTDGLLQNDVKQVNTLAARVAELNKSIKSAETVGNPTLELRDQRNELVKSLSEFAGVRAIENQDSSVSVTLADGQALVLNDQAFSLEATATPPSGLSTITLNGKPAVIDNGRLKGETDSINYINSKINDLDNFASALANRVNTIHHTGEDLNGVGGGDFFVANNGGPITAANISVAPNIKNNPSQIAAAAVGVGKGDGSVARQLANLLTDTSSQVGTVTGSFSSIYAGFVADAGAAIKTAQDNLTTQQAILTQTTEQRNAVSGVSIDEEAVNLLRYQRAFEAAARFLKVSDEITKTIIALGE